MLIHSEKLKNIPGKPGVYLLKDARGKILYVGKAVVLRDRLRSHFKPGKTEDLKHRLMMAKVKDFEVIVTDSEVEALILEANFIKEHRPRYNVNLKDDKSYPYIRVTSEVYPRIFVTRKTIRDGSRYFGPYTDVGGMRQLMNGVRRIFPVRNCNLKISEKTITQKKHKVCLMFHIGRCKGPCEGLISQSDYGEMVEQVVSFIQGKNNKLLQHFNKRMVLFAEQHKYEEAALIRDRIRAISTFHSRQKVADGFSTDKDLITLVTEGRDGVGLVFHVRDGKIVNRRHFYLEGVEHQTFKEVMTAFLKQYYLRTDSIPPEIVLSSPCLEPDQIEAWLVEKRGTQVNLVVPKKGKKRNLIHMCHKNAELLLSELKYQKSQTGKWIAPSVGSLQRDLKLAHPPIHIEAFDVSNLQGENSVAALVVFENGKPKKSEYRKYKIRQVDGIDDFRMMAEVVERRIKRILKEGKDLPDLIMVDGGKGQLSSALKVLKKFEISEQPIIGLAKRLEEIYVPGISYPQTLPKSSSSLRLLQRVRDEAHRFAITYHRSLRLKRSVASVLDTIPGIGEKRRTLLLKHFSSVKQLKKASVDEITTVPTMNRKLAQRVKDCLEG